MNLLARREHSRQELARKMRPHFDATQIEAALDRLAEQGLQSDRRFAESFARERMLRGYGPQRISLELCQRGVSSAITDEVLDDLPSAEQRSWHTVATEVLEKKFGPRPPSGLAEKARRLRFLDYRGFSEVSREVVGEALAPAAEDPDD